MEKSSFQFSKPVLSHFAFSENSGFVKNGPIDMRIQLNTEIHKEESNQNAPEDSAQVKIRLSLGTKDTTTPFHIEAVEEATFRWTAKAYDEKELDCLLRQNAVALLISYLRPTISVVTASSKYPAYNLPFMNLTGAND